MGGREKRSAVASALRAFFLRASSIPAADAPSRAVTAPRYKYLRVFTAYVRTCTHARTHVRPASSSVGGPFHGSGARRVRVSRLSPPPPEIHRAFDQSAIAESIARFVRDGVCTLLRFFYSFSSAPSFRPPRDRSHAFADATFADVLREAEREMKGREEKEKKKQRSGSSGLMTSSVTSPDSPCAAG